MFRCSGDDSFGPVLGPDNGSGCYNFDFTLTFEDCIFAIAPCGLLLLLAAWRLYDLARRPAIVRWPLLRAVKQVSSTPSPGPATPPRCLRCTYVLG